VPIGPTGADYEQNGPGTGYVRDSGRVRTILPHPTDANTVYLLTSGGGLWVTQNFTAALPAWRALTDSQVTTGGGSVAFGRTPSVIYCRTSTPICMPLRNPLAGRSAYTGISVKYPNFTSVTVNLGTAYAGKNVQIRFRVGTDKAARECCFDD
jgi:hypothetical protein